MSDQVASDHIPEAIPEFLCPCGWYGPIWNTGSGTTCPECSGTDMIVQYLNFLGDDDARD